MKCFNCGNLETRVIDSRSVEEGSTIRRRRECDYCKSRFTTFERRGITDLFVVKRDGTRELYEREKIRKALMLAFAKRKIPADKIESIISDLEVEWFSEGKEVSSKKMGDDILRHLKSIDVVAYVRFASVYKKFENIEDFKEIVEGYGNYEN